MRDSAVRLLYGAESRQLLGGSHHEKVLDSLHLTDAGTRGDGEGVPRTGEGGHGGMDDLGEKSRQSGRRTGWPARRRRWNAQPGHRLLDPTGRLRRRDRTDSQGESTPQDAEHRSRDPRAPGDPGDVTGSDQARAGILETVVPL